MKLVTIHFSVSMSNAEVQAPEDQSDAIYSLDDGLCPWGSTLLVELSDVDLLFCSPVDAITDSVLI